MSGAPCIKRSLDFVGIFVPESDPAAVDVGEFVFGKVVRRIENGVSFVVAHRWIKHELVNFFAVMTVVRKRNQVRVTTQNDCIAFGKHGKKFIEVFPERYNIAAPENIANLIVDYIWLYITYIINQQKSNRIWKK